MDFRLTDEQALIRQSVRQFAEDEMALGAIERNGCPNTVIARPRKRPWQSRMGHKHTRSPHPAKAGLAMTEGKVSLQGFEIGGGNFVTD